MGDSKGLLNHFVDMTGQPFEYNRWAVDGDYPGASMIAYALYDKWWNDPVFADSVKDWRDSVTARDSPLKYGGSDVDPHGDGRLLGPGRPRG